MDYEINEDEKKNDKKKEKSDLKKLLGFVIFFIFGVVTYLVLKNVFDINFYNIVTGFFK